MIDLSVATFTLILIRVTTFWFTLPVFGQIKPPNSVKIGLAFALSIFWFDSSAGIPAGVSVAMQGESMAISLGVLAIREMLVGGLLGFSFNLLVIPTRIAGSYLAQELGLSMATLTDPTNADSSTVVSTILQLTGLLLFFVLNLHHYVVYALHATFDQLPVASYFSVQSTGVLVEGFAGVASEGMGLIGPVTIALFVMLVAVLLLAKAVPAFNLFSVGISIRLLGGLLVIVVFLPDMINKCILSFESAQTYIERFVGALTNG